MRKKRSANWLHMSFEERIVYLFQCGMSLEKIHKYMKCKKEKVERIVRKNLRPGGIG